MVTLQHNAMIQNTEAVLKAMYIAPPEDKDMSGAMSEDDGVSSEGDYSSDEFSDDSSYDSDSDWSVDMEDIQNNFPVFHKSLSSPALVAMNIPMHVPLVNQDTIRRQRMMRVDPDAGRSNNQGMPASLMERMQKADLVIGDNKARPSVAQASSSMANATFRQETVKSPQDLFSEFLVDSGVKPDAIPTCELNGFFLEMSEENI